MAKGWTSTGRVHAPSPVVAVGEHVGWDRGAVPSTHTPPTWGGPALILWSWVYQGPSAAATLSLLVLRPRPEHTEPVSCLWGERVIGWGEEGSWGPAIGRTQA